MFDFIIAAQDEHRHERNKCWFPICLHFFPSLISIFFYVSYYVLYTVSVILLLINLFSPVEQEEIGRTQKNAKA